MTEKRFTVNYQNSEIVSVHDNGKLINIEQMVECLNALHEENQSLKKKIDIMADAFAQSNDLIEVEQVFYTKVCEPSEHYDEETLSSITNALLGGDRE